MRALGRPGLAILARGALRGNRRDPPALRPRAPRRLVRRRHRHGRGHGRRARVAQVAVEPLSGDPDRPRRRARRHAAALGRLARGCRKSARRRPAELPTDRAAAAARTRRRRGGQLARPARAVRRRAAPVYLRPNAEVSAALRRLAATAGRRRLHRRAVRARRGRARSARRGAADHASQPQEPARSTRLQAALGSDAIVVGPGPSSQRSTPTTDKLRVRRARGRTARRPVARRP